MSEYIEREALLELYRLDDPILNETGHVPLPIIRQNIMDIPAADVVEVVHGKWIDRGWDGDGYWQIDGRGRCWHVFECSACRYKLCGTPKAHYCPNCGCKMDLGEQ